MREVDAQASVRGRDEQVEQVGEAAAGAVRAPGPASKTRGGWRVWFNTARPATLTAAVSPVLVGTSVAAYQGAFHLGRFALTLVAGVLLQAGVNYLNEALEYKSGHDTAESLGSSTVIFRGEMTYAQVLGLGLGCFIVATLLGVWLIALVGPAILLFGLAALFIGFFYSAPPLHFAARGLGDVAVYIAMGFLMVWGAYYVQLPDWSWMAFAASVPAGFLVVAILNANNIRDYLDDRAVHKRTVVVRFGRRFGLAYHATLIYGAYAAVMLFVGLGLLFPRFALILPWPALLAWLSLPNAIRIVRDTFAAQERDPILRLGVRRTGALHFQFCALLALGVSLAAVFHLPR